MTRTELTAFEGQCVEFTGWIDQWNRCSSGASDVLIKPVKVRSYRLDENHTERSSRFWTSCDHLWLRVSPGTGYAAMQRLDAIRGYAKVVWYRRANQSVDLGLTAICSAAGSSVSAEIQDLIKQGNWSLALKRVQTIHRRILQSELAIHDYSQSPLQIANDISTRIIPMIKKNRAAVETALRRGRCKAPGSFAALIPKPQRLAQ